MSAGEMKKCHDLGYSDALGVSLSTDAADYGFQEQETDLCVKIGPLWYAGMKIIEAGKFVTPPWAGCCSDILPQPLCWHETEPGNFTWVGSTSIEDAIDLLKMTGLTRITDPKSQIDPVFANAAGEFTEEIISRHSGNIDKYGNSMSMNSRDYAFEPHSDEGTISHFMVTPLWYPAL